MANGGITPAVTRRYCSCATTLEALGCTHLFNQCSNVGESADIARSLVSIPELKVDEPMADEAIRVASKGAGRIAMIATAASTIGPSHRLIERAQQAAGVQVTIRDRLVDGALDVLMKEGNRDKHNDLVLAAVTEESKNADVVVLAPGEHDRASPATRRRVGPGAQHPRSWCEASGRSCCRRTI